MNTCRNCHLEGVAGAPAIDDEAAWKPRQQKGVEVLYQSALLGIQRDGSWSMPPRGGNRPLSDREIRLAAEH